MKAAIDKLHADHEAEHAARRDAMSAAVAKQLGLSADAVKAAFEANRPALAEQASPTVGRPATWPAAAACYH